MINQTELKQLVHYKDGQLFIQKEDRWRKKDQPLGSRNKNGYLYVRLKGRKYTLHHLIWLYFNGEWPEYLIHKDGNLNNNRIENLHNCGTSAVRGTAKKVADSTSKYKGVCFHPGLNKWYARCRILGISTHLGYFTDEKEAALAYDRYAASLNEFNHLNFPELITTN